MVEIPANVAQIIWDPAHATGSTNGTIDDFDTQSFIRLDVSAGVTYNLCANTTAFMSNDATISVYDHAGNLLAHGNPSSDTTVLSYAATATGIVYVAIGGYSGNPGPYDVFVSTSAATSHVLSPLSGADDNYTGVANERILAGTGDDTIHLGAALEAVGGGGDDSIYGNNFDNRIAGGAGNDYIDLGTGNNVVWGNEGVDFILGDTSGGNDIIYGGEGSDHLFGNAGNDLLHGGTQADEIDGGTGIDKLYGDDGNDHLYGKAGADILIGGGGADLMVGGDDNDAYYVDNVGDIVDETATTGIDKVYASISFSLSNATRVLGNVEALVLTGSAALNGTGNALNNALTGNSGNNVLNGAAGNDSLNGGAGADKLTGGAGADRLTGGLGADTFVYAAQIESAWGIGKYDTILDFSHAQGDRISLSGIDAKSTAAGDQIFDFIGSAAFSHHAGELRTEKQGADIFVYGDTNGDGKADFALDLHNVASLLASDFLL